MLTAVIATRQTFIEYCRDKGIPPNSREVVHVYNAQQAMGYWFDEVVELHHPYTKDFDEARLVVETHLRTKNA